MHDPTKVLLGTTPSSDKDVTCETGSPATFLPGLVVRKNTDGTLSLTTGTRIGVSLGESLDGATAKTAVCRTGNEVPILLTDYAAELELEDLTYTAVDETAAGNLIGIVYADEVEDASAEVTSVETDEATGEITITVAMESGATTADDILAAIEADAEADALVTVAVTGTGATAQTAVARTALADGGGTSYATPGAAVVLHATSGKADASGTTTGAVYVSGDKTGVNRDGTTASVALIAMHGGF